MRVLIFSDAHNEFRNASETFFPDLDGVDVCIVAGDFDQPIAEVVRTLQELSQGKVDIIYVAGNHEHYGRVYADNIAEGYRACDECPNVHFLENQTLILHGVRFLGATLWTDYALEGDPFFGMQAAKQNISDFDFIKEKEYVPATPEFFERLHQRSRRFLSSVLEIPFDDGPTIVVTHHAPHPASIEQRYRGRDFNGAYASDLTELLYKGAPALWVHGHTHHSFDYKIFNTRVICNPAGYPHAPNRDYNPRLIIDTDTLNCNTQKPMSYDDLFGALVE